MSPWVDPLKSSPLPALLAQDSAALAYFVRRDLLDEDPGRMEELWELPEPRKILVKQRTDGAWRYPGKNREDFRDTNYDLLETFRNLRVLIAKYGFDRRHHAIVDAAGYLFSCQTPEGDIRGILGNQYMPYYHGAIMELLIEAGYDEDKRVEHGLGWLLSMRQEDDGWVVPMQTIPSKDRTEGIWRAAPIPADPSKPSSHLATGMVLRAFAAHPAYREREEVRHAGEMLKARFFKSDRYNDRKAPKYWTKFQYPFWWSNLLTALDSLSKIGYTSKDNDIARGLEWFVSNQGDDGLWETSYGKAKDKEMRAWVGLAVCRVLKRLEDVK
jgi:hypothetical protein